jgi:uncharacterized protein (DUF1697 family)
VSPLDGESTGIPMKSDGMASACYLALLRGINVGGRNIIRMADLKACFEDVGCLDVATFIQSGNVVFRSPGTSAARLAGKIERALSARLAYASRVVVLTDAQLAHVVEHAPAGFGKSPERYKYDVIFLREPLTATEAIENVSLKQGVDAAQEGKGVLYFSRLAGKLAQSHLSRIVTLPAYQSMTIRNWHTTTKLLALMESKRPSAASK